jgi:acetylornithine/LysW-gamma-L-lysine aminotransferase
MNGASHSETSLASASEDVTVHQEETFSLGVYARRGLVLVRGENTFVWDAQGRRYIDCIAGHGSANIGHAHPAVTAAVVAQSMRLLACSNVFYNESRECLLLTVAGNLRHSRIRLGSRSCNQIHQYVWVESRSSAHSAHFTAGPRRAQRPQPAAETVRTSVLPGVTFVPFNTAPRSKGDIRRDRGSLEIVRAKAGAKGREFLSDTAVYARQQALLMIDEVRAGFGRTRRLFACEHFDLPDILCLASPCRSLPMGAVLCSERITISRLLAPHSAGIPLLRRSSPTLQFLLSEDM